MSDVRATHVQMEDLSSE